MKKTILASVWVCILCVKQINAQELKSSGFKFSGGGFSFGKEQSVPLYIRIPPQSSELFHNFGYFPHQIRSVSKRYDLFLDFEKQQSASGSHRLQIGLGLKIGDIGPNNSKLISTNDTLYTSTGEQKIIEQYRHELNYVVRNKIRLNASYLFQFQNDQRLSFFVGFGASIGTDFSGKNVNIYWNDNQTGGGSSTGISSAFTGISSQLYIPVGLDFNLNKNKTSRIGYHLFTEGRLGIQNDTYKNAGSYTSTYSSLNLGLRLKLH